MSLQRNNPLSQDILGLLQSDDIQDQVKELWQRVRGADEARQSYLNKQEKLIRQRRGIRKTKSFPWPGANNHSWPLMDAVARRWKPGMVALVLQAEPVCYFFAKKPEQMDAAPIAQDYYHWRFHAMADVTNTVLELADATFQYGLAYTRQGWEYITEKQCRICRVVDLFPNGVDAAVNQFNANLAQARMEAQAAVAQGQGDPRMLNEIPPDVDAPTLITQVLEDEYVLRADDPLEFRQIQDAVRAILKGAEVVKFYYRVVKSDKPSWKALDPRYVIVPPRCKDIGEAEFIALEHTMTIDDLLQNGMDGVLDLDRASALARKLESSSGGDPDTESIPSDYASRGAIQNVMDTSDGITTAMVDEPRTLKVFEIYCRLDIDGDGLREKCVLWYTPEGTTDRKESGTILALYPKPHPFFEWPIVRFEFEHNSNRPYHSRGGAELLSIFQATVNKLHNARLDAIQIALAPMLIKRTTAGDNERSIRFMPGAVIPVTTMGDVMPLQMDTSGLLKFLTEENYTKGLAEQYIGVFDPGILAENSAERRTATEVDAVMQQTQSIFGQDAALFQASMAKVHKQLWKLEMEFGPADLFFRVMGEAKPRFSKKSEIAHDYDIEPAGTPANTNQAFARRKALEMIQLFGADMTGLIDKHQLFMNYFRVMDRNLGKVIVRSPENAALVQQMMQLVSQMQGGKPPAATF